LVRPYLPPIKVPNSWSLFLLGIEGVNTKKIYEEILEEPKQNSMNLKAKWDKNIFIYIFTSTKSKMRARIQVYVQPLRKFKN